MTRIPIMLLITEHWHFKCTWKMLAKIKFGNLVQFVNLIYCQFNWYTVDQLFPNLEPFLLAAKKKVVCVVQTKESLLANDFVRSSASKSKKRIALMIKNPCILCWCNVRVLFSEINKPQELSNPILFVDHPYWVAVVVVISLQFGQH